MFVNPYMYFEEIFPEEIVPESAVAAPDAFVPLPLPEPLESFAVGDNTMSVTA